MKFFTRLPGLRKNSDGFLLIGESKKSKNFFIDISFVLKHGDNLIKRSSSTSESQKMTEFVLIFRNFSNDSKSQSKIN